MNVHESVCVCTYLRVCVCVCARVCTCVCVCASPEFLAFLRGRDRPRGPGVSLLHALCLGIICDDLQNPEFVHSKLTGPIQRHAITFPDTVPPRPL